MTSGSNRAKTVPDLPHADIDPRTPRRDTDSKRNTASLPKIIQSDIASTVSFLEDLGTELESTFELVETNPYLNMATYLIRSHMEARPVTQTSLLGASGVPYATATRRLREMMDAGLIEARARTQTGKSFSLHPSDKMIAFWARLSRRLRRLAVDTFGAAPDAADRTDYYFGNSYLSNQSIQPPSVLSEPLKLSNGLRILVHGDPTFMVMGNLKRQFELLVGCPIHQRAFSIDRLREEALANAKRRTSRYDIIAFDLPWVGEFATRNVLKPLDDLLDMDRVDPLDFHTAGWRGAHWGGRPYGIPSQTTPELFFYRRDLFAKAGINPPLTTDEVLNAARHFHNPARGRHGIAWNAARGTALGHTFIMTCADFGQPVVDLRAIAGGFDAEDLATRSPRVRLDTPIALDAARYLLKLMDYSPPNILSMSWYERIKPYAEGSVAMSYGYTLLAPYFELDPRSPAYGQTGFLPHPAGPMGNPIAPVGGYGLGIPTNIAPERERAALEALMTFTSPEAQKLYVLNGSRTVPRYSVGADPEVRRLSPIFEAVESMSWRDELQFWPRPPIPEISRIIQICGEEIHDMLRGMTTPETALERAQARADMVMTDQQTRMKTSP